MEPDHFKVSRAERNWIEVRDSTLRVCRDILTQLEPKEAA